MGICGSATNELIFSDCRIPKENLVGREGKGFGIAMMMKLRVIGPLRKETQIELSLTDARTVGLTPPKDFRRHRGNARRSAHRSGRTS